MQFVPQIQKDDCGFAALKMLLAEVHKDRNYLFIPQDEDHGLYTYQELISIASKYGVKLEGCKVEDAREIEKNEFFPFIATVILKEGATHAVTVYKVKHHRVYYVDPIEGKKDVPVAKFIQIWDGTLLKILDSSPTPCPYKEAKPISSGQWFIYNLLQVLSVGLAIAGVFFINDNIYIFLPIVLFSLAIIFEIALKAYSIRMMQFIDDYFFEQADVKKEDYLKTLKRLETYKKGLLTSPSNFIINFLITLALIVIILNNDLKNFLLVAAPLIASSIEALLYRPYIRRGYREVGYLENAVANAEDMLHYKEKVEDLHDRAYHFGRMEMFKRYIGLALFAAIAVVLVAINKMASFPYALFYVCLEVIVYHCLKNLFDYPEKCEEMLKEKVVINNCLHQNDENK